MMCKKFGKCFAEGYKKILFPNKADEAIENDTAEAGQATQNNNYGPIYFLFDWVLRIINTLNFVELFKFFFKCCSSKKSYLAGRWGIDTWIFLRWALIIWFWAASINNLATEIITWYLIVAALFSYFYNHVWTDDAIDRAGFSKDRVRGRFMNLLFAIAFCMFAFAYMYHVIYPNEFIWADDIVTGPRALIFSITYSFTSSYEFVKPATDCGYKIAVTELVIMFIFLTIVISKSIPETSNNSKPGIGPDASREK